MADADVPVVETPSDGSPSAGPEKPAAPLEPCAQPNRAAFETTLAALNTDIEEMQKKRDRLQARIQSSKGTSDELNARLQEARSRFAAVKAEHTKVKEERQGLLNERDAAREVVEKLTKEAKDMKSSIKFNSVEDVDRRLASLTLKQSTETMSLREERDMVREIETLRAARTKLTKAADMAARSEQSRDASRAKSKEINDRIGELGETLKGISSRLNAAYEALSVLFKEREDARGSVPELIKEKDALNATITAKYAELKKLKNDFFAADRAYNAYIADVRRQRYLAGLAEREARAAAAVEREAARVAAAEAAAAGGSSLPNGSASAAAAAAGGGGSGGSSSSNTEFDEFKPWQSEMLLCDMLIAFLVRLKPRDAGAEAAAAAAKAAAASAANAASVSSFAKGLTGPSGQRLKSTAGGGGGGDDEFAFLRGSGVGAGGGKGGKGKGGAASSSSAAAAAAAVAAPAVQKAQPITLGLDTLSSFRTLGLSAPSNTGELDAAIAAVAAKKAYFETAPPPEPKAAAGAGAKEGSGRGARAGGGVAAGGAAGAGVAAGSNNSSSHHATPTAASASSSTPTVGATVATPFGPGTLSERRDADGVLLVALPFATAYLQPSAVSAAAAAPAH